MVRDLGKDDFPDDLEGTNLTGETLASGTIHTYNKRLTAFFETLFFEFGISLPDGEVPNEQTTARYVDWLFKEGRSVSTARVTLAALSRHAQDLGKPDPTKGKASNLLKEFARKRRNQPPRTAKAIGWTDAHKMAQAAAETGTKAGLRDAAIIALASDCLLRVSEIAVIKVGDLIFNQTGTGILLIRHSKTDQFGTGSEVFITARTVDRLNDWMKAVDIETHLTSYLFRRRPNDPKVSPGNRPLSHEGISHIIKHRARQAGIKGRVTPHSFRRGSARSLARRGCSPFLIAEAGRWKSMDTVLKYVRGDTAGRGAVAQYKGKWQPPV